MGSQPDEPITDEERAAVGGVGASDGVHCSRSPECVNTSARFGDRFGAGISDRDIRHLRERGWRPVNGAWTCPQHIPN